MTLAAEGELDLWKAPLKAANSRAYSNIVTVGARPRRGAAVIGSIGTDSAAMALKSSTKAPLYPVVDDTAGDRRHRAMAGSRRG